MRRPAMDPAPKTAIIAIKPTTARNQASPVMLPLAEPTGSAAVLAPSFFNERPSRTHRAQTPIFRCAERRTLGRTNALGHPRKTAIPQGDTREVVRIVWYAICGA
jgi:hypothetical protein